MAMRPSTHRDITEKPSEEMMEVMDSMSDKERVASDPDYVGPVEEKAVLRKIDRNLMPVCMQTPRSRS